MLTDIQILNMLPLSPEQRQALIEAIITQHKEQKHDFDKSQSPDEPEHDCHAAAAAAVLLQQGSTPQTTTLSSCLQHRLEAHDAQTPPEPSLAPHLL